MYNPILRMMRCLTFWGTCGTVFPLFRGIKLDGFPFAPIRQFLFPKFPRIGIGGKRHFWHRGRRGFFRHGNFTLVFRCNQAPKGLVFAFKREFVHQKTSIKIWERTPPSTGGNLYLLTFRIFMLLLKMGGTEHRTNLCTYGTYCPRDASNTIFTVALPVIFSP